MALKLKKKAPKTPPQKNPKKILKFLHSLLFAPDVFIESDPISSQPPPLLD